MISLPAFPSSIVCLALLVGATSGQELRVANTLAPEDIGIQKYVFESKAPMDSVVVFRRDEYQDNRLVNRCETISSTPTEKKIENVLLIDWSVLKIGKGFELRGGGGGDAVALPNARLSVFGFEGAKLEFGFDDAIDGKPIVRRIVFTMFHEEYANAKKRIPQLRENLSTPWSQVHSPTITSKQ